MNITYPYRPFRAGIAVTVVAIGLSTGCSSVGDQTSTTETTAGSAGRTAQGFAQFPDIAVPAGAKMDVERSLVLGARDDWIGRLSVSASGSTSASYDFFLREMPKYNWDEITTVRSEVSVLTYGRNNRVATIQIRKRTLGGSSIDITVSPRGRQSPASLPAPSSMPASPAGAVETAPTR